MKKRNSKRLKQSLSLLSITILVLSSGSTSAVAQAVSSLADVTIDSNSSEGSVTDSSTTDSTETSTDSSTVNTSDSSSSAASETSEESSTESSAISSDTSTSQTTSTTASDTAPSYSQSSSTASTPTESSTVPSESAGQIKESTNSSEKATVNSAAKPSNSAAQSKPQGQAAETGPQLSSGSSSKLSEKLAVDSLTDSDLNGFELPLLNTLKDERSAAIIAESLKKLNLPYEENAKGPQSFGNLQLPLAIYKNVFGATLPESYAELIKAGKTVEVKEAQPGDLLFWSEGASNRVAIYLGQGKYMMASEPTEDKQIESKDKKAEKDIPGVRIYTLNDTESKAADEEDKAEVTSYGESQLAAPDHAVHYFDQMKLSDHGKELLEHYGASVDFKTNTMTEAFINKIGEDARELGAKYDVFASVMIAQAILESGSGTSGLSITPYFNLFGVKGSFNGSSIAMSTSEDSGSGELYTIRAAFRSYPSYKESLEDYVQLLRGGISGNSNFYKSVWRSEAKNYLQATKYLTGHYATDTSYDNKLNSIIAAYHLTRFDEPKASAGMVIQSRSEIPAEYRENMSFPEFNGKNYNTSGSYPVGQCTWYAYNRVRQLGGSVDDFMGNGGEWGATAKKLGYKTSSTPKAGYLVSFLPGVAGSSSIYGHVAFVEAVGPNGILVSEGNVINESTISYRVIPNEIARSNNVTYVLPK